MLVQMFILMSHEQEDFITILECDSGLTGQCIAEKILGFLLDCDLNITK